MEQRLEDDFVSLHIDSDAEFNDDSTDEFTESDSDSHDDPFPFSEYSIDQLWDMIQLREFHNWSLETLRHKYKRLSENPGTARQQLTKHLYLHINELIEAN